MKVGECYFRRDPRKQHSHFYHTEGTKSLQPGTGPLMDQTGTLISDFEV